MRFMSFYINGAEWTSRTEVLALATTDTFLFVHHRNHQQVAWLYAVALRIIPLLVVRILFDVLVKRHHLNRLGRAMGSTTATPLSLSHRQAIPLHPYGMSNLDGSFLFLGDGSDGSSGAYICTACTLRSAVASGVIHSRLQEVLHIG